MTLHERLADIAARHGLPPPKIEVTGEKAVEKMLVGREPPKGAVFAEMVKKSRGMRQFGEDFELLSKEFLSERIQLLDHQLEAAEEVFSSRMNLRAVLADEVGLGKTIEAGIIVKELFTRNMIESLLVLAPSTLVGQWKDEFKEKFDIDLTVLTGETPSWQRRQKKHCVANSRSWYWTNSRIREDILRRKWDLVIIDEAHHFKDHRSKGYRAILPSKAGERGLDPRYLLLLTATPVQNSLQELYSLLHLVRPGALGSYRQFRARFFEDSQGQVPKNTDKLREIVRSNMIRRRRIECGIDYTLRHPYFHPIPFPEAHRRIYQSLFPLDAEYLQKVHWLRQAASSLESLRTSIAKNPYRKHSSEFDDVWEAIRTAAKEKDAKLERLAGLAKQHGNVVVFTEYHGTLRAIKSGLEGRGLLVHELHGQMSLDKRRASVRDFIKRGGVFVSTSAGSEGLNLQKNCHVLVNYDLPWNPMKVEQRIGRVHRIGQTEEVEVHTFTYEGTIEDFITATLYRKLNLFKMSVGDIDGLFTGGTENDDFDLESHLKDLLKERATLHKIRENLEKLGDKLYRAQQTQPKTTRLVEEVFG